MADYHGSAELLAEDGTVIAEVTVYLHKVEPTATQRGEWGGQVDPTDIVPNLTDASTIRLPDGSEGHIIVSDVRTSAGGPYGTHQRATLTGSGPAPF